MNDHGTPRPSGPSYPPGRQPYDMLNGMRIGAVAGAVAGAGLAVGLGIDLLVAIALSAGAGAVTGYAWMRRGD